MVNLTRIYTRTGDDGTTALGDMSRTHKTDPRLVAYADVDEANSAIGVALAHGGLSPDVVQVLERIQNDLFDVGADLCAPLNLAPQHPELRITAEYVEDLETACDRFNAGLQKLRSFILPGGSIAAAHLHVARTVTRRAERAVWAAIEAYGTEPAAPRNRSRNGADDPADDQKDDQAPGGVNPLTAKYLNRLSDLLFILSRVANTGTIHGDVLWAPGGGRNSEAPGGGRNSETPAGGRSSEASGGNPA